MPPRVIDEIEAFRLATVTATERRLPWRPPYWIDFSDDQWSVEAEGREAIRIDATSGKALSPEPTCGALDPIQALAIARDFAVKNGLRWQPSFALQLTSTHWTVGACQSQLGGQTTIEVSHEGFVTGNWINPK